MPIYVYISILYLYIISKYYIYILYSIYLSIYMINLTASVFLQVELSNESNDASCPGSRDTPQLQCVEAVHI